MKLDYNLIKKLLEHMETESNGHDTVWVNQRNFGDDVSQEAIDYHLRILIDDDLLIAEDISRPGEFALSRLTAEGHRVLEAMQTDTIWNKIKGPLQEESLKQIPSLTIMLLKDCLM